MKTIEQILNNKQVGIDCTALESGAVKQILKKIYLILPNEFDEALEEIEKIKENY